MSTKTTVHLVRELIEVPCTKHGKPSYRWTQGYYVCDPAKDGPLGAAKIYPPVIRSEAYRLAREIAPGCRVVIDD